MCACVFVWLLYMVVFEALNVSEACNMLNSCACLHITVVVEKKNKEDGVMGGGESRLREKG